MNPLKPNISGVTVSTDKDLLDRDLIHKILTNSYWSLGRSKKDVDNSIDHSFCFGVYNTSTQIGFARVITDFTTFAYLCDVFIVPEWQGLGLSKQLMKDIVEHKSLQGLRRFLLGTRTAHGLYEKFDFKIIEYSNSCLMEICHD